MTVFTLDDDVLERIQRNDPDIKTLQFCLYGLFKMRDGGNIAAIGHDIGQTPSITELIVAYCHESYYENYCTLYDLVRLYLKRIPAPEWEVFFDEVCQSRSVKSIKFIKCDLGGYFLKLFNMPNVETVVFDDCTITRETLSALCRARRLQKVEFASGVIVDCAFYGTRQRGLYPPLFSERFSIYINNAWIEGSSQESLGDVFADPQCNIMELVLGGCSIDILPNIRNGLVNSSALRNLKLHGGPLSLMPLEGWQVVSDILSSAVTSLKVLDLDGSDVDDESADAFAIGLSLNTTLEELNLSTDILTTAGWLAILSSLQNSKCRLKQLYIDSPVHGRIRINDDVASSIAGVLIAKSDTIEKFSIQHCPDITPAGWIALCSAFVTFMPNLNELSLGNQSFYDIVTVVLASRFCNMPSLKILSLNGANTASTGWDALSKGLCDNSSLRAIKQSNHTLVKIRVSDYSLRDNIIPIRVNKLLKMNSSGTVNEAIALKIVQFCYDRITIKDLVYDRPEIQNKLVPSVISWLGRDPQKRDALYRFVLNQSYLFDGARRSASVNKSKGVANFTHWWEVGRFRKKNNWLAKQVTHLG